MSVQFVLDNSIVMQWWFREGAEPFAEAVLDGLAVDRAIVPAIWPLELGNAIVVTERRRRLDVSDSTRFLGLLDALPIQVVQETPDRMINHILGLARAHRLSTYDASYLDLAMRMGLPMATLDKALANAANDCGVPSYQPS